MLAHLGIYLARQGSALFQQFSPALALRVPRTIYIATAGGFTVTMIGWAIGGAPFRPIALLALLAWAPMQSLRLSNHVAFLVLLLVCLTVFGEAMQAEIAASLLGWMYLLASFYKINRDFLFTPQSVPRVLAADQYRRLTGRSLSRVALAAVPSMTVVLEFTLGVCLLAGGVTRLVVVCALAAHFVFLIIGHAHYSLVALGAWWIAAEASFPQAGGVDTTLVQVVVALGVLGGAGLATPWVFRWTLFGRCVTGIAAGLYALAGHQLATLPGLDVAHPGIAAMLVGFVVVGSQAALLVLGIKSEWAFAMFSNIRPFRWTHLIMPPPRRWRVRYFAVVIDPDQVPPTQLDGLPSEVRAALGVGTLAFAEPVACALMQTLDRLSIPSAVVPLAPNRTGDLRPQAQPWKSPRPGPVLSPPILDVRSRYPYFG